MFDTYYLLQRSLFKRQFFLMAFSTFQMQITATIGVILIMIAIQTSGDGTLDGSAPNVTSVMQSFSAVVRARGGGGVGGGGVFPRAEVRSAILSAPPPHTHTHPQVGFLLSLSAIPALYGSAGAVAGFAHRVGQLLEALDALIVAETGVTEACAPALSENIIVRKLSGARAPLPLC